MATPTNKQLHDFILASFNEGEFDMFCFLYFEEVQHRLSDNMPMMKKVVELIAYCKRQQKLDELLKALEQERPSTVPPAFLSSPTNPTPPPKPEPIEQPQTTSNSFIHEKTGLEFVRIPAGEFLFGEKKLHIYLPEFWMSKTPVTFATYQRFIRANPNHPVPFVEEEWAEPYNWDARWRAFPGEKANHPVVLVSWYDAIAFCEWAELQLPTEEQWEKAGRGTDGRVYPWGNEWQENHCNSDEANIGGTSAVGRFSPQGDSPYGCVDISGNVWEWCLNKYDNPEMTAIDQSNAERVLRGGSWNRPQSRARAADRVSLVPDFRFSLIGFRVVAVRPPSQDL